jgi:hypothetical protein
MMKHEWNKKFKNDWNEVIISYMRYIYIRKEDDSAASEKGNTCHHKQNCKTFMKNQNGRWLPKTNCFQVLAPT